MSLKSLRELRLQRLRPSLRIELFCWPCPDQKRSWLHDDPRLCWAPGPDIRAHDLRPLVGLPVDVYTPPGADRKTIVSAIKEAGARLFCITDGETAELGDGYAYADDARPLVQQAHINIHKSMHGKVAAWN